MLILEKIYCAAVDLTVKGCEEKTSGKEKAKANEERFPLVEGDAEDQSNSAFLGR